MSAASEEALGELHRQVAVTLTACVQGVITKDEEGEEQVLPPSPAYLAAAIAFLKNNNITANPSKNAALDGLAEQLRQKRKQPINPKAVQEAAKAFEDWQGSGLGGFPQ